MAESRPPATHQPSQKWYHLAVNNPSQTLCHVCLGGLETDDNQIILCGNGSTTGCDVAVHQQCYGVNEV